jgi:long-chain fatty acid transport protein
MSRCLALALVLGISATAHAGGVARPNGGSPHSVGMGGAFAAVADDAYCLHANPAGCAFAPLGALTALEFVVAPRTYVPAEPIPGQPLTGESQDATAIAPAPVLGILFKPGRGSPVTVGVGAWNTFGGILSWKTINDDDTGTPTVPEITEIEELVFEVDVGVGWAINDRVAIGGAIRIGVGLFAVEATEKPATTSLSNQGVGIGANLGLMLRPSDKVSIGLAWHSDLDVTTSGDAELIIGATPMILGSEHVQTWPQSVSTSVAFRPSDALLVAGQVDWTQWSSYESLDITFPSNQDLNQHFELDWDDSLTFRVGAQYRASSKLSLRGGVLYDQNAVPDRTIERQYLDANKFGGSLGTSVRLSKRMILDVAADVIGGPARTVPDNSMDVPDEWPTQQNIAPGKHNGQVFTLATGLRIGL